MARYISDNLKKFSNFDKLCEYVLKIRRNWKAISRLWNRSVYSDYNLKKDEDIIELINLYCINPDLLKSHLDILVNWTDELLKKDNLQRLSSQVADFIFKTISDCVSKFLSENWVIKSIKQV